MDLIEKGTEMGCGRRDSDHCDRAEAAADKAVCKMFAILGVDVDDPQQVREFQESLRFGEKMRKIADKSVAAFVLAMIAVAASAFIYGLKGFFQGRVGG